MHCSSFEMEATRMDSGEAMVAIAALVTEGRIPTKLAAKSPGFHEGPHCMLNKTSEAHTCNSADPLCLKYEKVRSEILELCQKGIPLCVEVVLTPGCSCKVETDISFSPNAAEASDIADSGLLLEQWFININHRRIHDKTHVNLPQLMSAVRSQLHFSQISAWLSTPENASKLTKSNIVHRLSVPGETYELSQFTSTAIKHDFPPTDIGNGLSLQISLQSLPRTPEVPTVKCSRCEPVLSIPFEKIQISAKKLLLQKEKDMVDDRMYTSCTLKGKHRCEDFDELDSTSRKHNRMGKFKRVCQTNEPFFCQPSTSKQADKPKLCVDLKKTKSHQELQASLSSELNTNDKRNLSPNVEQKLKNPKLDVGYKSHTAKKAGTEKSEDDLKQQSKGDILLNAILRSCSKESEEVDKARNSTKDSTINLQYNLQLVDESKEKEKADCDFPCVQKFGCDNPITCANAIKSESDNNNSLCDKWSASGDIFNLKDKANYNVHIEKHCDNFIPRIKYKKPRDNAIVDSGPSKCKARQRILFSDNENGTVEGDTNVPGLFDDEIFKLPLLLPFIGDTKTKGDKENGIDIPSASDQAKFRKSLDSATSMVFHSRTGLPLTSSPAPVRRGRSCFDFDSSINSVSAIGNALFSCGSDDDSESDGSIISPCSPEYCLLPKRELVPIKYYRRGRPNNLLGTFEESVLNGRLEPVSTVHGFTAELGASGSFVPKHLVAPVTVFFYNLGDNEKVSSPYLGHINLGKKGYQVPRCGTVQVTLFNPLGTVVKMFVIMYDLSEMPPNTQTFLRQRTLYMPTNCKDENVEWGPKWLRYLIHLRFMSSKSGRIYLHSDIRLIIFRKSDLDTATAHGIDMSYELRSFTHLPTNPRFSPRK